MNELLAQLRAHNFNTHIELVFVSMEGPVSFIDGLAIEASTAMLHGKTPFVFAVDMIEHDIRSFAKKDLDVIKYVFAPYTNIDGMFRFGKVATLRP